MKKRFFYMMFLCAFFALLAGCKGYEDPILFHVTDDKPESFPAEVNVHYSVSDNHTYLLGHSIVLYFKSSLGASYYMYPLISTNEGFKIKSRSSEIYPMKDPKDFGYSDSTHLKKQEGSFHLTFNNEDEYETFIRNNFTEYTLDYYR